MEEDDSDVDSKAILSGTPRKLSIISRPKKFHRNPASDEMLKAGICLYNALQTIESPSKLLNCKKNGVVTICISGKNLITWFCEYSRTTTRQTALGAWQVLIVEGVLLSASDSEGEIHDNDYMYYFHSEVCRRSSMLEEKEDSDPMSSNDCDQLITVVKMLLKRASDAFFRMVLQKPPKERTPNELDWVYNELLQIKSLTHLSPMILRKLTQAFIYEAHHTIGEVLFNQGDEGTSWYIILRGSVDVHVHGKGVVCTLKEGDDFGKLALVNNSPRAATLFLKEDNCHFLRIDKFNFNSILRDVEANKVRLKEHDKDVLILGKETNIESAAPNSNCRYSILSGTPEKMLEYILQSLSNNVGTTPESSDPTDTAVDDFILTHLIFMTSCSLVCALKSHFVSNMTKTSAIDDKTRSEVTVINKKRSVIFFLQRWYQLDSQEFFEFAGIKKLVNELNELMITDCQNYPSLTMDAEILKLFNFDQYPEDQRSAHKRISNRSRLSKSQTTKTPSNTQRTLEKLPARSSIQPSIKVHLKDHSCMNLHLPFNSSVSDIIRTLAKHLNIPSNTLILFEMRSDGEKHLYESNDFSVTTALSVNGRLFVAKEDDIPSITPLPEQFPITEINTCDLLSSINWRDLAHFLTQYDCELFEKIRVCELVAVVFGRRKFNRSTRNLDLFIVHFSRIQYWVITHICLTQPLAKRVALLKKFIKTSQRLLDLNNISTFFSIMMALNNSAVGRLSQTWDKLSHKYKKLFEELSSILDPSRNHRVLRQTVEKIEPPIIPFLAILLKDMTFTHEGNKTYDDNGLINFEKMQLIGKILRLYLLYRSKSFLNHLLSKDHRSNSTTSTSGSSSVATSTEIKMYLRKLECIDDQKLLTQFSQKLEPKS